MAKAKAGYWTAKRKRDVARRMIGSGHNNQQIKDHIMDKAGSSISSSDLAKIRVELDKPGNGGTKKKKKKMDDVFVLPIGNNVSTTLKQGITQIVAMMKNEGIERMVINSDGTVSMKQMQNVEFSV